MRFSRSFRCRAELWRPEPPLQLPSSGRPQRCTGGKLPQFRPKSPHGFGPFPLAQAFRGHQLKSEMTDTLEKRLIEALQSVEAHGDVAPVHVHDPMTMLLRENAIQTHLMRWDDARVALRLNVRLRPFANITAVKGEIQGSPSLKLAA